MRRLTVALAFASTVLVVYADDALITPLLSTAPLFNYEDAPATPDADDPAIWINRGDPRRSLVIGTAKDAGLIVYDLSGHIVQAILPPNAPQVLPADPATPAGVNLAIDNPCIDSHNGETFGRYNNVDIAYNVRLGRHPRAPRVDVAVVSDRGCDRLRFFHIDPSNPAGPLVDVTSPDAPRVFVDRYDQPSSLQPSGGGEGWRDNPVDDQNTVYGLAVAQRHDDEVFVSQRERGLVRQLRIDPGPNGTLTYSLKRSFLFDTSVNLRDEHGVPVRVDPVSGSSRGRTAIGRSRIRCAERHALCGLRNNRALQAATQPFPTRARPCRSQWIDRTPQDVRPSLSCDTGR